MDDDITFGTSVWGLAPDNIDNSAASAIKQTADDANFDDFDDFGSPAQSGAQPLDGADDDDFGDFGDFGDAAPMGFEDALPIAGPSSFQAFEEWKPLQVDLSSSRSDLEDEVNGILAPVWADIKESESFTDDPIREREGVQQILATRTSQDLYKGLTQAAPPTKPPNWTRSRIRRQHFISLGIPINLDEVLPPHANGKALPPLQISTRPMSAPPGQWHSPAGSRPVSTSNSRAGSPMASSRTRVPKAQFGPRPPLDDRSVKDLIALEASTLSLEPLSSLERKLSEIKQQTANTSNLLTYLLQTRDALQQDSETYNGLIAELVGEAQKVKTGKAVRTPSRQNSKSTR